MHRPEEFAEICQAALPFVPWMDSGLARLPGMKPLDPDDWLVFDTVYDRQMAYRDWLIARRRADVVAQVADADDAARELLETVLAALARAAGYRVLDGAVERPDGVRVDLRRDDVMATVGRLAQDDFCLLQPLGGEHVLIAAVLCFPASWTLAEKIGRPLTRIHKPVPEYDGDIGARVQRMFDRMQPGTAMFRANALVYGDPDLHQPPPEAAPKVTPPGGPRWVRVERQTIRKLPRTGAIAFGIHTYLVRADSLSPAERAAFGKLA